MNVKVKIASYLFVFLFIFASCDSNKKENVAEKPVIEENEKKSENEEEVVDQGYEIAMSAYQCPMKCEGDKTYDDEGACPKCNMDLKKVDEADNSTPEE